MTFSEFIEKKRALETEDIKIGIENRPWLCNQGYYILESKKYGTFRTSLPSHGEGNEYYQNTLKYLSKLIFEIENSFDEYNDDKFDFVHDFDVNFYANNGGKF